MAMEIITGDFGDGDNIIDLIKDDLLKERNTLRSNGVAWAVVTQVMAREKGNIELAFLGFL